MERLLSTLVILVFGFSLVLQAAGQESLPEIDLLYPEFSHPQRDAADAIKRRDFRFIAVDRTTKNVPGLERYPRLKEIHGTKFVKQRFRLFANASENFSFDLRARAYAGQYNRTLLRYLLTRHRKKLSEGRDSSRPSFRATALD